MTDLKYGAILREFGVDQVSITTNRFSISRNRKIRVQFCVSLVIDGLGLNKLQLQKRVNLMSNSTSIIRTPL